VIVGRVAADDVEAVRAINSEIRDLLSTMEDGLRNLDVETVRKAASKARSLGQMLTPGAEQRVQQAVDTARRTARQIVKAGEQGAAEIDQQVIREMISARTAFLDIPIEDIAVAEPETVGRADDLAPVTPTRDPAPPAAAIPAFAMEDTANEQCLRRGQSLQQRATEIREVVALLARRLAAGQAKVIVGPQGAIAFTGLTEGRNMERTPTLKPI
jgi:hypothetical protein